MKKKIYMFFKVILASALFMALIVFCSFLWLINDARLDLEKNFPLFSADPVNENVQSNDCLENESLVYLSDLKNYLLFSKDTRNFENWMSFNGESLQVINNGKEARIEKTLCLPKMGTNDCLEKNCFQQKIPFELIPSSVWKGLIGIEDSRFLEHNGVDWTSVLRALIVDLKSFKLVQGGSTITQQLVKNLFLTSEKKFLRKFKEMAFSIYLESVYSKEKILLAYINEVYWGGAQNNQIKGIVGAALFYFSKRPEYLNYYEVSILISMLKGPGYYSPFKHLDRLQERTDLILQKLIDQSLFPSSALAEKWNEAQWEKWQNQLNMNERLAPFRFLVQISPLATEEKSLNGPLNFFENFVFDQSVRRINAQLSYPLEQQGMSFKAIIGKIQNVDSHYEYYSRFERNLKMAVEQEKHQIGSTIKPLLYKIFLTRGKKLSDYVSTSPFTVELKSGLWSPKESAKITSSEVTLAEAVQKSMNWPTLRISYELGIDEVEKDLRKIIPSLEIPLSEYPSQLLGSTELSLYELYKIYSDFVQKECYELRNDDEGEESSDGVLEALSDPKITTIRSALSKLFQNYRFFGKTGTTNNGHDSWYIAYNGQELFVIWFGKEALRNEQRDLKFFGASTSYKVFEDFSIHRGKRFPELFCLQKNIEVSP